MPNAKLKCSQCKERFPRKQMTKTLAGNLCSEKCIMDKIAGKKKEKAKKQHQIDKKRIKSRIKWFSELQILVNQYVVHVRDKGKPCFTCGTAKPEIKYDAGHRHHAGRGGGDRRRFFLINIHKQCSVNCNQHGGGMPKEYDLKLDEVYGAGTSDSLACEANFRTLKEQFPTWQDIEQEMIRYRVLLRENGVKPNR